ncbi:hypothetical protein J2T07_003378 [Luteibacter jiangsuensis]|uniref:Lipoprotein n=1 Tax=Luteibacter jiangsuensis TaxID=637577 RepID=A0ABT9T3L8_9GAMM|nr:hypothetical protein [Luteibacter jiangsuensis]MDQ0011168.1 hypothetical protein [Luteibacter jiangsuensis]
MDMLRYALASLLIVTIGLTGCSPKSGHFQRDGSVAAAKRQPVNGTQAVAFVRWYRGLWLGQDNFCTVDIPSRPFYLRTEFVDYDCKNDVAQSVELQNLPPGTVLYVYDSPNCGESDDWGKATVLKQAASLQVGDFNHTFTEPAGLQYDGHYHNGINGKLSCFIIDVPDINGRRAGPVHDK